MPSSIYLITNSVNGKYYVGKTSVSVQRRLSEHIKDSFGKGRNSRGYLHASLRKYGRDVFAVEVLARGLSDEQANLLESLWILILRSTNSAIGYNLSSGGDGFSDPTGVIRSKISKTLMGRKIPREIVEKIASKRRGRKRPPFTEETRIKLSMALRRKPYGPEPNPEIKKQLTRARMSAAAKRRWAVGKNTAGSIASLVIGRTAEHAANAREALKKIPAEVRREMLRRAANIRWHGEPKSRNS